MWSSHEMQIRTSLSCVDIVHANRKTFHLGQTELPIWKILIKEHWLTHAMHGILPFAMSQNVAKFWINFQWHCLLSFVWYQHFSNVAWRFRLYINAFAYIVIIVSLIISYVELLSSLHLHLKHLIYTPLNEIYFNKYRLYDLPYKLLVKQPQPRRISQR